MNHNITKKIKEIRSVLSHKPINIEKLQMLGRSYGGFINRDIRKKAWPILLNFSKNTAEKTRSAVYGHEEELMKDKKIIQADADRSLIGYSEISDIQRPKLQLQLNDILASLFEDNPKLYYVQGFHDIASVILMTLGSENAPSALDSLANYYFKDLLRQTFEEGMLPIINTIFIILEQYDRELYLKIKQYSFDNYPGFAISWIITWFSHELTNISITERIFDYMISSHPLASSYLAASIIEDKRHQILALEDGVSEMMYMMLKEAQWTEEEIEMLLEEATKIEEKVSMINIIQPKIKKQLHEDSPIISYQSSIIAKYKNNSDIDLRGRGWFDGEKKLWKIFLIVFILIVAIALYFIISNRILTSMSPKKAHKKFPYPK